MLGINPWVSGSGDGLECLGRQEDMGDCREGSSEK